MTLEQLKKAQSDLINAVLADYPEKRAVELANKILRDLDDLDKLEEEHIVKRTDGHYEVRKKDKLTDPRKRREKLSAVLENEISCELRQKIRRRSKRMAGLR